MTSPISPPPVQGGAGNELPAYVANGVVGLRVRAMPLAAGLTLLSGYSGEHPQRLIEAIAVAPYPVAGDIQLAGVWLSDAPHAVTVIDQAYDFATGELTSRFEFEAGGCRARVEVLVFCSREEPSLVCQEIAIELDADSDLALKALVDARHVDGRALRHLRDTPGEDKPCCDGAALWESAGALSTCGIAYVTELVGAEAEPEKPPLENRTLTTAYAFKAKAGQSYRLRQIASLIPKVTHLRAGLPSGPPGRPRAQAGIRGYPGGQSGSSGASCGRARITLARRGSALAGPGRRRSLLSVQLDPRRVTRVDLDLRSGDLARLPLLLRTRDVGHRDLRGPGPKPPATARGREHPRTTGPAAYPAPSAMRACGAEEGLQFPWESAPSGQEAAPLPGSASWHEDHVSLDVARAFAFHSYVTGDLEFLREKAWPILSGVADWIASRVTHSERGYEIRAAMGIAERETEADNAAFTNMSAVIVLRDAICRCRKIWVAPPNPNGLGLRMPSLFPRKVA